MIVGLQAAVPARELQALIRSAADNWHRIAEAGREAARAAAPTLALPAAIVIRHSNLERAVEYMRFVADHLILVERGPDGNDPMAAMGAFSAMIPQMFSQLKSLGEEKPDLKAVKTGTVRELRPGNEDVPPQKVDPFGEREATHRLHASELAFLNGPPEGCGPFHPFGGLQVPSGTKTD